MTHPAPMNRRAVLAGAASATLLGGCVTVGIGTDSPAHTYLALRDAGEPPPRRATPLVPALVIQPLPADAVADTASIAYARQPHAYSFYQQASWTERPVRQLPRLLQRRLEARGTAAAVGLAGEPLRSDLLLTLAIDALHHDVSASPSLGRLALTVELVDRRQRTRLARRSFEASVPASRVDSAAAAEALSRATGQVFDALLPWLEAELARPVPAAAR